MAEEVSVEVENLGTTQRNLKITVAPTQVAAAMKSALEAVRKKAHIKGFRKGKAPDHMIKKTHGQEIHTEAMYQLLDSSYVQALDICDLQIIGHPSIRDIDFQEGKPLTYVAQVEIFPEITVKKYKGLKIKVLEDKVDEKIVDERLEQIRKGHGRLVPFDIPRALQMGDYAIIDVESSMDGNPVPEASGNGLTIEMGKTDFIPGFEGAILSAMPEEEREFDLTFPQDHEVFAGKDIHFKVKVNEIKQMVLPELNDEFAKDVGDFKTLDELRQRLLNNVTQETQDRQKQFWKNQVLQALLEENPIEVPQAMIDHEIGNYLEHVKRERKMHGQRVPEGDALTEIGQHYRPEAENRVKIGLLLKAVSDQEDVQVVDQDVEQYLQKIAEGMQKPLEEVRKIYQNEKALESIRLNLKEEKTLEILKENAKIIKKIQDLDDLENELKEA